MHEYVQTCDEFVSLNGRHLLIIPGTQGHFKVWLWHFCVSGSNVKNGELSQQTETKTCLRQIKYIFYPEKGQKSDSNAGKEVQLLQTTLDLSTSINLGSSGKHENNS